MRKEMIFILIDPDHTQNEVHRLARKLKEYFPDKMFVVMTKGMDISVEEDLKVLIKEAVKEYFEERNNING